MTMDYVIGQDVGSFDLIQLFITEGLLPQPMAVRITAIVNPPTAQLFSFRTYELPNTNGWPFNSYSDYQLTWSFLSYQDLITP